jgi:hypothetical protein
MLLAIISVDGQIVKPKMIESPHRSAPMPLNPLLRRVAKKIRSFFSSPPEDPHNYALVGAPVKPKPPTLTAKAAAVPER